MVLYHFSPATPDTQGFLWVSPSRMGTSINAGREIQNQFTNGQLIDGFLKKSNWFTKDSTALELHRFGYMNCYSAIIDDCLIYNMDECGFLNDVEIRKAGFHGYYTQGQVRMFYEVQAQHVGKIQLPQGITFKTVGNAINGENLDDYLV